jgi:hypothetical protein
MLGLSRLLVAVLVLVAQGGGFVVAREEERRGLRGVIDSTQDRNEIFKDEANLKLKPLNLNPLELSLLKVKGVSTRVVGGQDTTISQYPYYARIDLNDSFLCGGTLISPEFILTAAHCNYPGNMTVTLGTDTSAGTGIKFAVTEKIPHPQNEVGNPDIYDVLLLRLNSPAPQSYVNNIPLLDDGVSNNYEDAFNVIGLGSLQANSYNYASKLQVATVNRVNQQECKNTFLERNLVVSDDMLCAHAIGKDACQGDSGGPLVIIPNGSSAKKHILVGLTSWGVGCADLVLPGVYARVSHVQGWIKETICQQNLSSKYVTNTGTTQLCINLQGIARSRSVTRVRESRTRRRSRRKRRNRRKRRKRTRSGSESLFANVVCATNESARQNCPMTCNTCPL